MTPAVVEGRTYLERLETAANLLRSHRSPIEDEELSGALADLLDQELVRCRPNHVPCSAHIRAANAVCVEVFRRESGV